MKKIRFGVLGYARIAETAVIPALMEAKNALFHGVASRNEAKGRACQEKFGCPRVYSGYEALLEDPDIDAVYIPLPNAMHREWTVKAMEAGKHVLCEKPLALSEAEVALMMDTAKRQGVLLMEAFMYRYTHRTRQVEAVLQSGVLGEVKHLSSTFRFLLNREGTIKMMPELGGGALYDVGCYPLNFAGMVMGTEPVSVLVAAEMQEGVDVSSSVLLQYPGGATAALHCGFNAFGRNHSEIIGTRGRLEVPDTFLDQAGELLLHTDQGVRTLEVPACRRYVLEVEDFAGAILEGRPPALGLSESRRNARLMDRIQALVPR